MKQSELEKIAIVLRNEYGLSDMGHYEITAAAKEDGCWLLTVQEMKNDDEGAENESDQ